MYITVSRLLLQKLQLTKYHSMHCIVLQRLCQCCHTWFYPTIKTGNPSLIPSKLQSDRINARHHNNDNHNIYLHPVYANFSPLFPNLASSLLYRTTQSLFHGLPQMQQ